MGRCRPPLPASGGAAERAPLHARRGARQLRQRQRQQAAARAARPPRLPARGRSQIGEQGTSERQPLTATSSTSRLHPCAAWQRRRPRHRSRLLRRTRASSPARSRRMRGAPLAVVARARGPRTLRGRAPAPGRRPAARPRKTRARARVPRGRSSGAWATRWSIGSLITTRGGSSSCPSSPACRWAAGRGWQARPNLLMRGPAGHAACEARGALRGGAARAPARPAAEPPPGRPPQPHPGDHAAPRASRRRPFSLAARRRGPPAPPSRRPSPPHHPPARLPAPPAAGPRPRGARAV